jgi:hypothetical protein
MSTISPTSLTIPVNMSALSALTPELQTLSRHADFTPEKHLQKAANDWESRKIRSGLPR